MRIFEILVDFLGSLLTPLCLLMTAFVVLPYLKPYKRFLPRGFVGAVGDIPDGSGSSPFAALSMALAGTLGVGNITGVASALVSGGAGAVFWMWAGAVVSITVKYAEVFLAVKYRQGRRGGWFGGAMYYIRDGLSTTTTKARLPYGTASVLGVIFAILCCFNSLVTGNIVQSNAAACVMPEKYRLTCGVILGVLVIASLLYGSRKIEKITAKLMPPLTGVYMLIAAYIIICNFSLIPKVFGEIFHSAFAPRAVFGGAVGFSVREGIRFGVMRGIFSNEAGCGTSPTAHAVAETKSPHNQACCGIIEVVFDTLILCTMTAVVLLIADLKYSIIPWKTAADTAPVTLNAFRALSGDAVYYVLIAAVVLFAYATIIAQIYYGTVAIGYITRKKLPLLLYYAVSAVCTVIGSVISSPVMWTLADIIIGTMTTLNCAILILLRRQIR